MGSWCSGLSFFIADALDSLLVFDPLDARGNGTPACTSIPCYQAAFKQLGNLVSAVWFVMLIRAIVIVTWSMLIVILYVSAYFYGK